jgi:hypothetical protein
MRPSAAINRFVASMEGGFVMIDDQLKSMLGAQVRDLKLLACIEYAHSDWDTPKMKTKELNLALSVFRYNISRVRMMMIMPSQVGEIGMKLQKFLDLAKFEVTGSIDRAGISDPIPKTVASRFDELWQGEINREAPLIGTPQWDIVVLKALKQGLDPVIVLGNSGPIVGFHTMFASYITTTWTAIETMAGDLWEAALNAHPAGLSNLGGQANRLRKTNRPSALGSSGERLDSKLVPLSLIQMNKFDLRQKMGTILKERFGFSRLEGIREAYASAFHRNNSQIDAALSDDALDALSAVRNVIVHRAALADTEYFKKARRFKLPIGKAGVGALVPLNGEIVVNLIAPAIGCATKLLGAVDDWISNAAKPKTQEPEGADA